MSGIIVVGGKKLVKVDVPCAERRRRPVYVNRLMENGTYKRNGEGDYHCSIEELKQMLRDISELFEDSVAAGSMEMDDLDPQPVGSFCGRMSGRNPAHPRNDLGACLKTIGACSKASDGTLGPRRRASHARI